MYSDIMEQIGPDSIRSSIDMLRLYAAKGAPRAVAVQIDELEQRYFYMLRYVASGHNVPDISAELQSMTETARDICVAICRSRMAADSQTLYSAQLRYQNLRPEENLQSLVSDYLAELERLSADSSSLTDSRRAAALERLASDIFMRLWVEMPLASDDVELLLSLFEDDSIPDRDRELWLGAVGLGLLSFDAPERRRLLLKVVASAPEFLSAIASVWLVLVVSAHTGENGGVSPVLRQIADMYPSDIADVFFELFRACGTKELSDDLVRDVLPGMMDMGRKMADRFAGDPEKLENALRNGEWDDGIDVSGFEKIKGFIEAQNRGDDVYMATLGKMRQFPFFNNIPNWFLPFHTGHSALADVTDGEGLAFADTVSKMPFLCDSDKYALLLSVAMTPAPMRENMLRNIAEQQAAMGEEMLEAATREMQSKGRRAVMSRYVKNLYRFFSLFRRKNEFPEVFSVEALYAVFPGGMLMESDDSRLYEIADLLLRLRYYPQALSAFHLVVETRPDDLQAVQKLGFVQELDGYLSMAEDTYLRALDIRLGDAWTTRRLVNVLFKEERYDALVRFLEPMQESIADDAELLGLYAKAAYRTGDYTRALELYYNIAYLDGGDAAKPDLAWLLVLNGDFDSAEATFADFIDTSADPVDYLHYGHLLWAKSDVPAALNAYTKAASMVEPRKESFVELFADSFRPLATVLAPAQVAALRTVPDIIAFRTYGSRFGKL